jgi:hypothetical protein
MESDGLQGAKIVESLSVSSQNHAREFAGARSSDLTVVEHSGQCNA